MKRELDVVLEAVQEAGEILSTEFEQGLRGHGGHAPVDAEIGALLTERIGGAFPSDSVICEEGGRQQGSSGRAFVIDPHDGTSAAIQGRRETSISVGLVEDGKLLIGVVHVPGWYLLSVEDELRQLWTEDHLTVAWAGGSVTLNGRAVQPKSATALDADSRVLVSTTIRGPTLQQNRRALAPAQVIPCASIATRFALVAAGLAEGALTWNNPLAGWDLAGVSARVTSRDPFPRPLGTSCARGLHHRNGVSASVFIGHESI